MAKYVRNIEKLESEKIKEKITYKRLKYYSLLAIITFIFSLLSIIAIYKIVGGADLNFYRFFEGKTVIWLFICLFMYFAFDCFRFYFILKSLNITIPVKLVMKITFLNVFVSNITPSAAGGGFIQIYYLNKYGVNIGDATAATTIRTAITIVFFIIAVPITIIMEKNFKYIPYHLSFVIYTVIVTFIYIIIIIFTVYKSRLFKKSIYFILRKLRKKKLISRKHFKKVSTFFLREVSIYTYSMLDFIKTTPHYTILSVIFSALFLFSSFTFSIILIKSLGYSIPVSTIISYQIIITFIMYFAPTPGSTGIAEGAYSYIFSSFINRNDIVILTAVWRFFTIYIGMIIGMFIFYYGIIKNFVIKKN